jgi:teichuronic acid exporter|tara:strand:+ start:2122 stop:3570 length:1449 start_codon:yes stop_codon:yes gene_type:complete
MSNNTSLKSKTTSGLIWSFVDKFSVQVVQLFIGVVLARLLIPEDYGLIGMLSIFIAISTAFISSGMGTALIQRKNRTEADYSTVLIFNFGISILFYTLLFFSAPFISGFYNTPELTLITRVIGINLLIDSLALVQRMRLTIQLNFKTLAKINVTSILASGIFAIYLAYLGYGVWALVLRQVLNSVINVFLLWIFSKWKPSFVFSKESFKNLFGFGSKLLAAGLYATALQNINNVLIGKVYSASSLGFYTQATQLANMSAGTISGVIQQVTFPVLSTLQDDKARMVDTFRRLIKMSAFFNFPMMFLLAIITDPFIQLLLGDKWLNTIPLLQLICFARLLYPLSALNLTFLNSTGRSDLFLKVDLAKAPLIILALVITIPISVKAIVISHVVVTTITYFFNTYYLGKLHNYGGFKQLKDISRIILATVLASTITYFSLDLFDNHILKLAIGCTTMLIFYFISTYLLKIKELDEVKLLINGLLKK